jgi:hypothetical protein
MMFKTQVTDMQDKIRNYLNQKSMTYEQHQNEIRNASIKDAHLYCLLANVPSAMVGRLLEARIGGASPSIDIHVSLKSGVQKKQFHYTQVRICDEIEVYLMTAYDLSEDNAEHGGVLYVFRVDKDAMLYLLSRFGQYAHGTIKEQGKITLEKLKAESIAIDPSQTCGYALRPVLGGECWEALMKYRVLVDDVAGIISTYQR